MKNCAIFSEVTLKSTMLKFSSSLFWTGVRVPFVLPFSHYRQTRDEIVQVWSLLRITLILSFRSGPCKLS